jgi:FkbM family methyltransferase
MMTGPENSIFKLDHALPCSAAEITPSGQGLTIVTPPARWSDAVHIPANRGALDAQASQTPLVVVSVSAKLLYGRIAIGCVALDGCRYLAEAELDAATGKETKTVSLVIEDVRSLGKIVIRNARDERSSAILEGIKVTVARETSEIVAFDEAWVAEGATINSVDEGLSIATPMATWSYAVVIPFRRSKGERSDAGCAAIITAALDVQSGQIGFGALPPDGGAFLDERALEASSTSSTAGESVQATLLVDNIDAFSSLVVRNRRPLDQPSTAVLKSVRVFVLENSRDISPESVFAAPPTLRPVRDWPQYYGNRADNLLEKLRMRAYRSLQEPIIIPWLNSLRIWLRPGEQTGRAVAASGLYEPGLLMVLKALLPRGAVFLDVGANVGLLSLFAARLVGPEGMVHAFEPSPREYARLAENVALNGLEFTVRSFSFALGAKPGTQWLHVAEEAYSGLNTFGGRYFSDAVATADLVEVPVTTLDDYAAENDLKRVDMIKLDTEGYETFVLQGSRTVLSRWRPALLIEVSRDLLSVVGSSVRELDALLRAEGYTFYGVDEGTGERRALNSLLNSPTNNVLAVESGRPFGCRVERGIGRSGGRVVQRQRPY